MAIPIQNIYYLLCYAWNILPVNDSAKITSVPGADRGINLLAFLLQMQIPLVVKKGLAKQYVRQREIIGQLKGKIEIGDSFKQNLFSQGKAVCSYEQLTIDILPNQIIKATLHYLVSAPELSPELRSGIKNLALAFREVSLITIDANSFNKVRKTKPLFFLYQPILSICELLWQNLLPAPGNGKFRFIDFLEDEQQMSRLFEAFVRNFYRREQQEFTVKSEQISWRMGANPVGSELQYLPRMLTDISLQSEERKIIIDTKFYKQALTCHYQKQKLISSHLYQLFAYLKNQQGSESLPAAGILLYPVVHQELDLTYKLHGHQVGIKTLNLAQPWQNIRADLLTMIA